MKMMDSNKHLAWAERLCSSREYCAYDVRIKLITRGAEPEETEQIIAALIRRNFLNEERYIRAFVHDKSRLQGWGSKKIQYTLRAKQLPDALIHRALAAIDQNAQKETLRRLLEAKRRSIKATSEADLRAKLIRFALSRGFAYEAIVSATTHLLKESLTE
jgi:regulatory protein